MATVTLTNINKVYDGNVHAVVDFTLAPAWATPVHWKTKSAAKPALLALISSSMASKLGLLPIPPYRFFPNNRLPSVYRLQKNH